MGSLGKGFIDSWISARQGALTHLEDFSDRLNHFFSSGILIMFAGVTMANVYFLRPIACTLPTAPENRFNEFAESVCWVRGTIGLNPEDPMPNDIHDWEQLKAKSDISFYQWVPFCLSFQAMLFFIPHAIWQSLARYTLGTNLESILEIARKASSAEDADKRANLTSTAAYYLYRLNCQHIDNRSSRWAQAQRKMAHMPGGSMFVFSKRLGNCVSFAYLFIKVLYLINAIGQLCLIRTFLGYHGDLISFGNILISTLVSKREWIESEFFPRQTYCPVNVRQLGTKSNVFTAICALPVNMFNEKIYIFLWLWICLVSVTSTISMVMWFIRLSLQPCRSAYIKNYLNISISSRFFDPSKRHDPDCPGCNIDTGDQRVDEFIVEFVRNDGFFLLRMLRDNAGDVVAGEILSNWWHLFVDYKKLQLADKRRFSSNKGFKQLNKVDEVDQNSSTLPSAPFIKKEAGSFV